MNTTTNTMKNPDVDKGNIYIMTHSIFSDVVRIGCTAGNTEAYARTLSKSAPGDYHLVFTSECDEPCALKKRIKSSLTSKVYVDDFYSISTQEAENIVKRELMRIPSMDIH